MADKPNPEQERLMRLRDKQVSARDPHVKTRKFSQQAAERERKRDKSISPVELWRLIPQVGKGGFFGLLLGLALLALVTRLWISPYTVPVMLGVTVIFVLVGVVIGNALDLRDDIKRHM
jgi:hypothetical protein